MGPAVYSRAAIQLEFHGRVGQKVRGGCCSCLPRTTAVPRRVRNGGAPQGEGI
jgi:hypothetical protein